MRPIRLYGPLLLSILCLTLLAILFWNDRIVQHYVDKIWLHRTNTIKKYGQENEVYNGRKVE